MNLVDAIKSGKPFRRKGWHEYAALNSARTAFVDPFNNQIPHQWDLDSWIADDWEIDDTAVLISNAKFWKAADSVLPRVHDGADIMRKLAAKLGIGQPEDWCVARDRVQTVDEDSVFLDREDLTADDWEVQEPEVTITATAYEAAVDKACAEVSEDEWGDGRFCAALKKNLGLGEV